MGHGKCNLYRASDEMVLMVSLSVQILLHDSQ